MIAKETVLIISDTQYPFAHKDHFEFLEEMKAKYKPTQIVHIGDELDFHALGDYDHDPDGDGAGPEFIKGLACMKELYKLFPTAKVCFSNHTSRPFRRAFKHGIPKVFLRKYEEFLEAPAGWQWGAKFEIDGVLYEHGEGCGGKMAHLKAAQDNMQSTVMGHVHSNAGVEYSANPKFLVFGMAVGCLIDKDSYAMAYGRTHKAKPILGAGIVDKGIPMFVPMLLDKHGRWVGKI